MEDYISHGALREKAHGNKGSSGSPTASRGGSDGACGAVRRAAPPSAQARCSGTGRLFARAWREAWPRGTFLPGCGGGPGRPGADRKLCGGRKFRPSGGGGGGGDDELRVALAVQLPALLHVSRGRGARPPPRPGLPPGSRPRRPQPQQPAPQGPGRVTCGGAHTCTGKVTCTRHAPGPPCARPAGRGGVARAPRGPGGGRGGRSGGTRKPRWSRPGWPNTHPRAGPATRFLELGALDAPNVTAPQKGYPS